MPKQSLTFAERTITPINGAFIAALLAECDNRPDKRRVSIAAARAAWVTHRRNMGYVGNAPLLTAPDSQPKLGKSNTPTYGLMLTPETGAGMHDGRPINLCPAASRGCAAECLNTAGKGRMSAVQRARLARTLFLLSNPTEFGWLLIDEIARAERKHGRILVRLNVVSDIRWERVAPAMFALFGNTGVTFYDYTAWSPDARTELPTRQDGSRFAHRTMYTLTYSRKETTTSSQVRAIVTGGGNVAVVFAVKRGQPLPSQYLGFRVIDGDKSDDRTTDPRGVIVGLRAKGDAIGDTSGFVVPVWDCTACGTVAGVVATSWHGSECGHIVASRYSA